MMNLRKGLIIETKGCSNPSNSDDYKVKSFYFDSRIGKAVKSRHHYQGVAVHKFKAFDYVKKDGEYEVDMYEDEDENLVFNLTIVDYDGEEHDVSITWNFRTDRFDIPEWDISKITPLLLKMYTDFFRVKKHFMFHHNTN